jgi:class 3 adenylate cyclase
VAFSLHGVSCLAEARRSAIVFRVEPPRGTVTTLFTDIEGSTRLLREVGTDRIETLFAA